jgi:hypothetical protein
VGRGAAAVLALAALGLSAATASILLREEKVPPPVVVDPPPAPKPPPPPVIVPLPVPPERIEEPEPGEEDEEWKEYPEGAKGPVVIGRVAKYGDPDPECWVALESVDDPARIDPSEVETLDDGRFRMTGMKPGRYRVRVKEDETLAAYSAVLDLKDGAVAHAGVLRLRRHGSISGVLRDARREEVAGEVRLFGRDPASLETRVVETAPCIARQGFQLHPHEAGEFTLAATAEAGYAIHRGKTDRDGLGWVDLPLRPWASVAIDLEKKDGDPEFREARFRLEAIEVPDLGALAPGGDKGGPPALFEKLPSGRYRVRARWEEKSGGEWKAREAAKEVTVAEGEAARTTLAR